MIERPMLAADLADVGYDFSVIPYPVIATPKIDGHRAYKTWPMVYTGRHGKEVSNLYAYNLIKNCPINHVDGELTIHKTPFKKGSGLLRRKDGTPDVRWLLFDSYDNPQKPYRERLEELTAKFTLLNGHSWIKIVPYRLITSPEDLEECEQEYLEIGYEGVCLRHPGGTYKQGRSTLREFGLVKIKRTIESDGVIVGFKEMLVNDNEQTRNAFGLAQRSTHQEGMIPAGVLGAFVVQWNNIEFDIGSGLDDEDRELYWNIRESLYGARIKFKHQPDPNYDKPRHPVFLSLGDD